MSLEIIRNAFSSFVENEIDENLDWMQIDEYVKYFSLLKQLQQKGEYFAAVEYIAGFGHFQDIDTEKFTLFCKALFNGDLDNNYKVAHDINKAYQDLSDEKKYIFPNMISKTGQKIIKYLNEDYACVRALRYEKICAALNSLGPVNVIDIGCSEGRLEEHFMLCGYLSDIHFNGGDANYYILLQARYRNRNNSRSKFFYMNCSDDIRRLLEFQNQSDLVFVISEVIEHWDKATVIDTVLNFLAKYSPKALIITTPNFDFTEQYKKDDPNNKIHKFEYRKCEFEHEMQRLAKLSNNYRIIDLCGIAGDGLMPQSLYVYMGKNE